MIGTILDDRFTVDEKLAEGAHGVVYRGRDLQTGQFVALKVLRTVLMGDEEYIARIEREWDILRHIDHPNTVGCIHIGVIDEFSRYLVMEFISGPTLAQLVDDSGPIDFEVVDDYLHQIGSALDAAHSKQIVHRDIKPGNLMIQITEAGTEVVKLLDFGLATTHDAPSLTKPGTAVGTAAFISPEQVLDQPLSHLSDIYSLGITLFALLTGYLPYEANTKATMALAHVEEPIPKFADRNPEINIPEPIEAVVRRALSKNPYLRPQTAGELAQRFHEAVVRSRQLSDSATLVPIDLPPSPKTEDISPESDALSSAGIIKHGPSGASSSTDMLDSRLTLDSASADETLLQKLDEAQERIDHLTHQLTLITNERDQLSNLVDYLQQRLDQANKKKRAEVPKEPPSSDGIELPGGNLPDHLKKYEDHLHKLHERLQKFETDLQQREKALDSKGPKHNPNRSMESAQ